MSIFDLDLNALATEGIEVEIIDPTTGEFSAGSDGKPVVFTVLGQDSSLWEDNAKKLKEKHGIDDKTTIAEVSEYLPELLAMNTVGWTDNAYIGDNEPFPCTFDNALKAYKGKNDIFRQVWFKTTSRLNLKKKHKKA